MLHAVLSWKVLPSHWHHQHIKSCSPIPWRTSPDPVQPFSSVLFIILPSSPQCEYNSHSCRFHNPILLLAISLPEDDDVLIPIPITPILYHCTVLWSMDYAEGDIILEQVNSSIVMRLGNVKSSAEKIEYHETISASLAVSESASQTFIITKEELNGNGNGNEKKSFQSQLLHAIPGNLLMIFYNLPVSVYLRWFPWSGWRDAYTHNGD